MEENSGVSDGAPVLSCGVYIQEACPRGNIHYLPVIHVYTLPLPLVVHSPVIWWNNKEGFRGFLQLEHSFTVDKPLFWEWNCNTVSNISRIERKIYHLSQKNEGLGLVFLPLCPPGPSSMWYHLKNIGLLVSPVTYVTQRRYMYTISMHTWVKFKENEIFRFRLKFSVILHSLHNLLQWGTKLIVK